MQSRGAFVTQHFPPQGHPSRIGQFGAERFDEAKHALVVRMAAGDFDR